MPKRKFIFDPQDSLAPTQKVGLGVFEPGEVYTFDGAQVALAEADSDFREVKRGKQTTAAPAADEADGEAKK